MHMNDKYYEEFSSSLKLVFDLTSRIDERIKTLVEDNNESKTKLEKLADAQNDFLSRVIILENKNGAREIAELKNDINSVEGQLNRLIIRMADVEKDTKHHATKWSNISDFLFKIGVAIIGGLILWKLGIKP